MELAQIIIFRHVITTRNSGLLLDTYTQKLSRIKQHMQAIERVYPIGKEERRRRRKKIHTFISGI